MKKRKREIDPDVPIGKLTEVPNFLPPPEELAKAERVLITTIALDADTIAFFKREAAKRGKKYQRMMREVLKRYAEHYNKVA